ncbi:TBC-domain-containing protein [Terfezia boudieri ATCC MYA-4762]|uniref:TBC-domain-containing protein n=1 Tax=Terfezia boudieri ATCC MYA-4762 TaxID=1051890 RepID=A0A3N4LD39_9PEZI|nr:TBC-domain-containing protein [Terfezia boudieri ATCC MYA-4762]
MTSSSSSSCSPLTSRKSLESSPLPLSLETEQLPFSSLQSPLMKSLVSPTADRLTTDSQRPALFDDHVASSYVPGSLHLVPDSTIERLVERLGAIPLIRQLAEDLAHRDRELVLFRLKADERERTLKKMLVEVEVSNADIEKRLASCLSKQSHPESVSDRNGDEESYTESINDLMQQALDEEDAFSMAHSASPWSYDADDGDDSNLVTPKATLRVQGKAIQTDTESIRSTSSHKSRGWKEYLWGTKVDITNTGNEGRRASVSSTTSRRKIVPYEQLSTPSRVNTTPTLRSASRSSTYSTEVTPREDPSRTSGSKAAITFSSLAFHRNNYNDEFCRNSQFKAVAMASESTSESSSPTLIRKLASDKTASLALKLVADARSLRGYIPQSTSIFPVNTRALKTRQSSKFAAENYLIHDPGSSSARDDLQRIITRNSALHNSSKRKRTTSISSANSTRAGVLANGKPSAATKDRISGVMLLPHGAPPPDASGPVEMDTIVPHAVQPPTLLLSWNEHYPADYLTDRFGFIYDKKHRSDRSDSLKSRATVESNTESPTGPDAKTFVRKSAQKDDGDQSELPASQVSSSGVALPYLEHVPAGSFRPTQRSSNSIIERMTRPSATVLASAQSSMLSEVPLALRTQFGVTTAEENTVKVLLRQLSDMHDTLQRDRSIKWNEFLKKVREERRRGEVEENGMPEVLMADGELIGVSTLGNSGKGGKQKWKEFRRLVIGGIPVSYRWKVWAECSGAGALRVPGYYDELLQAGDDDPHIMSQISMDINRTLTNNIFFRKGPGVHKLKQVLIAYSRRNPGVGYCQGMNMITASLLLIMPTEEDAFWVLVSIVENILPKTYFEPSLLASRADQIVLKEYVKGVLPLLDDHLQKLGVELEALTFQWFLSIFTDCLAGEALFRVWDVLLCVDGSTFLFQTALALLRLNENSLLECDTAAAVYSYLNSNMTHQGISIDGLIQGGDALKNQVKREDVEKKRELAIKQELALSAREEVASSYAGSIEHSDSNEGAAEGSETRSEPRDVYDVDARNERAVEMEMVESVVLHRPSLGTLQASAQEEVRNSTPSPPSAPWVLEFNLMNI